MKRFIGRATFAVATTAFNASYRIKKLRRQAALAFPAHSRRKQEAAPRSGNAVDFSYFPPLVAAPQNVLLIRGASSLSIVKEKIVMRSIGRTVLAAMATAAFVSSMTAQAVAQGYPTRPVEMIVTWGPGGGADQTGRMIGRLMEPLLKVSMPVDNVPGAAGVTGLTKLLGGQPDGYQVGIITGDTLGLLAEPKPQRWSLSDLQPIAVLTVQSSGFFAKADGPYKTWADVEAKAKTTELKVGVTGLGTPDDVAVEQMRKRGLKLLSVPFAKPSERYVAVVGGHADLLYEQAGDIRSFIEGKQLTPVLFLANAPVAQFPDVPTTKKLGMNLVLDQYRTIMVKAGTPPAEVKLLTDKAREAAASPEYAKFLSELWADPKSVMVGDAALKYVQDQVTALKSLK